ncbi:MAG: type II toxin-antitoxin system VapC family toxin, partial [Methanobacteriota archaeon]
HKNLKHEKTYFTRFFAAVPVYPFGAKAAAESSRLMARLYKRGTPVNSADVMIAGITLSRGGEGVITKDRDFERIQEVSDLDIIFI